MAYLEKTNFYNNTTLNSKFLEYWNSPYLNTSSVNTEIVTISHNYENRPDLYSYYLYNTPRYLWTFKYLNPSVLQNPIWDFKAGTEIRIFRPNYLAKVN